VKFSIVIALSIMWSFPGASQVGNAESGVGCFEELFIPPFGTIAKVSQTDGTVRATVAVGENGRPKAIRVSGPDPRLELEVKMYLELSKYRPSCAGSDIEVLFSYKREGSPSHDIFPAVVTFRPPNHFTLTSRPILPSLDPGRPLPSKKK